LAIEATMSLSPRRKNQFAILAGIIVFALALCGLVVIMMMRRGPAVAY
jgi:hypothetical protein